jgi:tetratricopeptide (TPR) repeat protein
MRDAEQAYEISKRIHNLWGISYSRMNVGMILRDLGHYEAAIEAGLAAIRDGNAAGFMAPAPLCGIQLVAIYLDLGDVESAEKQAEQVGQAAAATPVPEMKLIGQAATIAVLIAHGEVQEALDMYHQHLAGSILSQIFLWYYSDNIDIKGELLLGNYEKAFDTCEKLLAELEGFGLTGLLADLHYLKARCLAEMDRPAEAGMALEKAQTTAEKINQRRHLWRIYDARANLDEQSGKSQQATDFRRASAEVIAYIADHTPPDLREKFLAQGEVRRIVEKANG